MRIAQISFGHSCLASCKNTSCSRNFRHTINGYAHNNGVGDIVEISTKNKHDARKRYENLVMLNVDDCNYTEPAINTDDIRFLLDLDDESFKKIITKPVKYKDERKRDCAATIFFYTDGQATRKLLDKLNDKKAAFEILATEKDWRGTTALHTAGYAGNALKAKAILAAVDIDDMATLMEIQDFDDTPYSVAISRHDEKTLDVFKKYFDIILEHKNKE